MSPRTGFDATLLPPDFESPKLTIIVPPIQSSTLNSFTQVNTSPKNTRDTKKVNKLEELLKIVFDCKENQITTTLHIQGIGQTYEYSM